MPHVVQQCSTYFDGDHIGNGELIVAKMFVMSQPPAIARLLQGHTALHRTAVRGHVAVVETLLRSGVDFEARDQDVSCGSLYSRSAIYIMAMYTQ